MLAPGGYGDNNGGSVCESNAPETGQTRLPPVLKTGTITGPHALPINDSNEMNITAAVRLVLAAKLESCVSMARAPTGYSAWRGGGYEELVDVDCGGAAELRLGAGQAEYRVLYDFGAGGPTDAIYPNAGLISDERGNLYGTASGGLYGGVVFQLALQPTGRWKENILYNFCSVANCLDGVTPLAGLMWINGNLYGTTLFGGAGQLGTVFELSPPSLPGAEWSEKVLWSFCSNGGTCNYDGIKPQGKLVQDSSGNLYGTTPFGGPNNGGIVFELAANPDGSWTENILYSFGGSPDGSDPRAGLIFDLEGNLYGATEFGGDNTECQGGCGTVYQLSPNVGGGWTEKVIAKGQGKQVNPFCDLSLDSQGNLYGTTEGGTFISAGGVFKLTRAANWKAESFIFNNNDEGGQTPLAGVIAEDGVVYGTTYNGGSQNSGTVFKITSAGETVLHNFCSLPSCQDGKGPYQGGLLLSDHAGHLFGTAYEGGMHNEGVVFEITP